jgi:multiple sugar transport system substrate-binding protein
MRVFRDRHAVNASSLSRRSLVQRGSILGLSAALAQKAEAFAAAGGRFPDGRATFVQSTPSVDVSGTELKILQWSHFVASHDEWFDQFVQEWGDANGVAVTVDHVNTADIPAAFAAEISAESGHDLIEHIASLAQFEEAVIDMRDLWDEMSEKYGEPVENSRLNSYNPTTDKYYAFVHGYAPDPANYRKSLWEGVDLPNGPATLDELLAGGTRIWNEQGVQMGLGMSQEIDSQMAAQSLIWAFGGAIQDENENVVINSPETIEAVNFMKELFANCMTPEVFSWNAASNNQLLAAGQASYILNSISAYRTAQDTQPDVALDIFFSTPLVGPAGEERALAHAHAAMGYYIPTYSPNQDTAKEFLRHLVANYEADLLASKLYNFPTFPDTAPSLQDALMNDPAGSEPADKLSVLADAADWTVNLGWPGPANALAGEAQTTFILSNMMAKAAREEMTPEEAVAEAETLLNQIADNWRGRGLMGGGQ